MAEFRALAVQTRRNNEATLKTRRELINFIASDARISAEAHAVAKAFGEKTETAAVPASALVWPVIDDEIERQKAGENNND